MRLIQVLLTGGLLASCTTAPPRETARAPEKQAELAQLVAGKVAQQPISCLPYDTGAREMRVIDEETIAYRDGSYRTYVAHMNGACSNLGSSSTALVTHLYGTTRTCRGD